MGDAVIPSSFTPYGGMMATDEEIGFPKGNHDERELLLSWLRYLRGAVLRNVDGLSDEESRWTRQGRLMPLVGIVNHLTRMPAKPSSCSSVVTW